jgi:hypothetical protein
MVIKTMNTSKEAKQRAKNYMKLKGALKEKEENGKLQIPPYPPYEK